MIGLSLHLEIEIAKVSCLKVAQEEGGLLAHENEKIDVTCTRWSGSYTIQ